MQHKNAITSLGPTPALRVRERLQIKLADVIVLVNIAS